MMRYNKSALLLTAAMATSLGWSAAALAQSDATPAVDDTGNDIIVTAQRVEQRLQDVPISITVFTQQQVTNANIVNAGDLARVTPSLTTNGRFGPESTSFAIRGFVQEGPTSPSVGVYFADVIAPRANGGTTGGNGAGPGAFFDLQNVQVLKGPQGTLFGRNTTGGAVLLVPQKPRDRFEGYIEGSYGNYDMYRVQGVINAPLSDSLRVRLGVDHQKRDGFLNNVSPVGPRDFADVNYVAARLSVVADLAPNIENYTIASYNRSETNGFLPKVFCVTGVNTGSTTNVCNAPGTPNFTATAYRAANLNAQILSTPGYYDVSNGNPNAGQWLSQWQVINTTTWKASDTLTIKNIMSYSQFRQKQSANINGDNGFDPATGSTFYFIGIQPGPGAYNTAQATFTEELQFQGHTADDKLTYQFGGYYERATPLNGFQTYYAPVQISCTDVLALRCTDLRGQQTPNGAGGNLEGRVGQVSISRSKYWFRNAGIYGQATYNLTSQISLTAGIRYTFDKVEGIGRSTRVRFFSPNVPSYECAFPTPLVTGGTSAQVLADPSVCDVRRQSQSNRPTWMINLDYKPTQDIMLYAKYARGYRQGSINVAQYGLEFWGPEKVDTYEIGAKTSFNGAFRGYFNIAAFYNDFTDQQIAAGLPGCTSTLLPGTTTPNPQCPFIPASAQGIANAGSSRIKGVEIDASVGPIAGFRLDFNYAYLDSKIVSIEPLVPPLGFVGAFGPAAGGPIPLTPKNKFTITGSYTLPVSEDLGRITLSATYSYQDSTYGSSNSRAAQQTLPAQKQLNLNLNWDSVGGLPVDLGLFATNVTKEEFHIYTTGASNGFDSYVQNQPRMYGARLRYRFGN